MLILAVSVGVPGLVLSSFAFRSVRTEALVEQAAFQERCESVASLLYDEAESRFTQLEQELGGVVDQAGDRWTSSPGLASATALERVEAVEGILILDDTGNLRYPVDVTPSLAGDPDRRGIAEDLRAMMGHKFREAQQVEIIQRDHGRAASLYKAAIPGIPGYRGRLIARNARARSLYKAGRSEDALEAYRLLAQEASGHQDLNGFPLDLLATYQLSQCQAAVGDQAGAATTLYDLVILLSGTPWSYGGDAESVIADKVVSMLSEPSVRVLLPGDLPTDLHSLRRDLAERSRRQALEAMVLAMIPDMAISRGDTGLAPGRFVYTRRVRAGRPFLFARTLWRGPAGTRHIVLHLDEAQLLEGLYQRLDGIQQANPELHIDLGEVSTGPSPLAAPSEGVVYQLEPWVSGRTIVVTRGDPTRVSSMLSRTRRLRLLTIGAFSLFILIGLGISYRAVRREFEIARLRTDFVSNVSHELRTPLATIRIMAEMLNMGAVPPGEKQQEYHSTILSETERLTRLIENVLDFARIEQGRKKYRFQSGDLLPVVAEVQRSTHDYLGSLGFELEVQAQPNLPPVRHDRDALVQALINLVSNAAQYTDSEEPGRKRITISAYRQRDMLVLSVRDRGQGISPADRSRVFDKFQRGGDYMTRTVRGTGLGLSIVQHIVEAHGGEVRLESEPERGSTFFLLLPVDIQTY